MSYTLKALHEIRKSGIDAVYSGDKHQAISVINALTCDAEEYHKLKENGFITWDKRQRRYVPNIKEK